MGGAGPTPTEARLDQSEHCLIPATVIGSGMGACHMLANPSQGGSITQWLEGLGKARGLSIELREKAVTPRATCCPRGQLPGVEVCTGNEQSSGAAGYTIR